MYNLNYTPTILGVQIWRDIISGGTRTNKVDYHWSSRSVYSYVDSDIHVGNVY
jgi:hypothetical protein